MGEYRDHIILSIYMILSVVFVIGVANVFPIPPQPTKGIPHNYWIPKQDTTLYNDSIEMEREWDSINAYHKHWYEVLDTNSDGEIDEDINKQTPDWTGTTQGK